MTSNHAHDGAPAGMVGAETCLSILWPDEKARPCLRTFRRWQSRNMIPVIRLGRRTFFDPAAVRMAIVEKYTIQPR